MNFLPRKRLQHPFQNGRGAVEILLWFAGIFLVLVLFVPPRPMRNEDPTKDRIRISKTQIATLETALDSFRQDVDRYPTTDEGLEVLVQPPLGLERWEGPYLKKAVPSDAWGHRFVYRSPSKDKGKPYDVYSMGPNGIDDGGGDDVGH